MRGMFGVLFATALTVAAWGVYGPVLHNGQHYLGAHDPTGTLEPSRWRPFICVGVAYFFIAIIVPGVLLVTRGEKGSWSTRGIIVGLVAGAMGAIGALGIISAFNFGGKPIYVMPLVFGGAPVVNTFVTMYLTRTTKQAGPIFFAGLILVVVGAATVMVFKPTPVPDAGAAAVRKAEAGESMGAKAVDFTLVVLSIATTALCWGAYGSMLHKGQAAMGGSRMRPLMCVGVAYFLIAVLIPAAILAASPEPGGWNVLGASWSLAGGAAGRWARWASSSLSPSAANRSM